MNKIIIRISNNRLWIIGYNLVGAMIFIPLTIIFLLLSFLLN